MSVTITASTSGQFKPTSEIVEKNRPGGVDQPLTRFMPQAIKIAAPHVEPISAKNPPTKALFNVPTPFYSMISSLSSGSVNGTGFGSVWYQYATDV